MDGYICKICGQHFTDVPKNAAPLVGSRGTSVLYKFSDGSVHDLKLDRNLHTHNRWHVGKVSYSDCRYCNPEPDPVEEIKPDVVHDLVQPDQESGPVAVFLDEEPIGVPIPLIEEEQSPAEPEEFHENNTMSMAFRRMKKNDRQIPRIKNYIEAAKIDSGRTV